MPDYINIPYGPNATLRIRKSNIIATVSCPDTNRIDIYVAGAFNPWYIKDINTEEIINKIWMEDTPNGI